MLNSPHSQEYFYPRSPCGERQARESIGTLRTVISIHALLAESDVGAPEGSDNWHISIHALLAESDPPYNLMIHHKKRISIHALLAESDETIAAEVGGSNHFYPRSPCGERRVTVLGIQHRVGISIHALLAESDYITKKENQPSKSFLSTLSLRRATAKVHKTVGHFCAYETNFMEIASSC